MVSSFKDVMRSTPFPNHIKEGPKLELAEICTQYSLLENLPMVAGETRLLEILGNSLMKTGMAKSTRTENCKLMSLL
jgi:hypothetical protein